MLMIISAAKSLDYKSTISLENQSFPRFEEKTKILVKQLKKFSKDEIKNLLEVSENLASLNFQRFKDFSDSYNLKNSKQAILVFNGDVFQKIAKEKFSKEDFLFAQKHLRILSGLYGSLRPFDLIQPYRLEMGTKFQNDLVAKNLKIKNLYQFWSEEISDFFNEDLKKSKEKYIINLASEEYAKAVDSKKIKGKIINVIFQEKKKDQYKIVGILAKKARGSMVNWIIKNKITDVEKLKNFSEDNYKFNEKFSDENNLFFVR